MKTIKLLALLAAVLTFAACEKENKDSDTHERDIVYTVDEDRHDAHLTTDAEFDTLLEEFCDFAQEGSTVTFYNALKTQNSKLKTKNSSKEVTYRTTSREEIKRWMRRMEDEGKTVTITYDSHTGTYNGLAYKYVSKRNIDSQYNFVQCLAFRYKDCAENNSGMIYSDGQYIYHRQY